jgi:hypothetical protein
MNFRVSFRVEPAHILAHQATCFGMVSPHTPPKPQGTTAKTMCVAKYCTRKKCTHQIEASWMAEKTLTTPPSHGHAV